MQRPNSNNKGFINLGAVYILSQFHSDQTKKLSILKFMAQIKVS